MIYGNAIFRLGFLPAVAGCLGIVPCGAYPHLQPTSGWLLDPKHSPPIPSLSINQTAQDPPLVSSKSPLGFFFQPGVGSRYPLYTCIFDEVVLLASYLTFRKDPNCHLNQ